MEYLAKGKIIQQPSPVILCQFSFTLPHSISTPLRSREKYIFIRKIIIFIRAQISFCQDLEGSEDLSSEICGVKSIIIFLKIFM